MNLKKWFEEQDKSFVIAQISGFVMMLFGIVFIVINACQKFSLMNLGSAIRMAAGFLIALIGLILVSVSYRIRWQHMVEKKLNMLLWVTGMTDDEEGGCTGCCSECTEDCGSAEESSDQ